MIRVLTKREAKADEAAERFEALRQLGVDAALGGSSGFVVEKTAASLLGITPGSLRGLGLRVKEIPNPHYRTAAKCRLYDPRDLVGVVDDARVTKAKERKNPVRRRWRGAWLN